MKFYGIFWLVKRLWERNQEPENVFNLPLSSFDAKIHSYDIKYSPKNSWKNCVGNLIYFWETSFLYIFDENGSQTWHI